MHLQVIATKLALAAAVASGLFMALEPPVASAQAKQPNILVIFGDDVGYWNLSAYNHGAMGYRTPNIDRLAKEGALFTDYYGQQSCTAGRAAFITGQSPIRTGLTKVGLPGSTLGLQKEDPTIANLLKPLGYMTFQNGKNHLGDRNEFMPTVHGFDEFYGNLYHLNAEQEPENVDYPKNPEFGQKFGPRGVLKCKATTTDNPAAADPRFGAWGKQTCEDTGPLTIERMKTADEEFLKSSLDDMDLAVKAGKPFFIWHNTTRMHIFTHLQPKYEAMVAKYGIYGAGMQELDDNVGILLKKLDDLGIANNTIVIFSSDNGAEVMSWPDGGTTPFRGEKNTNWEGGYRVPFLIRWPGVVKPGTEVNQIAAHEDMMPTLLAAAGAPDVKEKLLTGYQAGDTTYKVHLDGYNLMPYLKGDTDQYPRKEFLYWTDDGDLAALRYDKWKVNFMVQRAHGFDVWEEPFVTLRVPQLIDLRADPFERGPEEGMDYDHWRIDRIYLLIPAQTYVGQWISSFQQFPPRQKPASFNLGDAIQKLSTAGLTLTTKPGEDSQSLAGAAILGSPGFLSLEGLASPPLMYNSRGTCSVISHEFEIERVIRMKKNVIAGLLCIATAFPAIAQKADQRLTESTAVLKTIADKSEIPNTAWSKTKCVLIYPSVKKVAFGVGQTYGRGVLVCRTGADMTGPWGAPIMYTLDTSSLGFQLGSTSTDYVLLIITQRGADKILSGKLKLGAGANATAGPTSASAATFNDPNIDILSYSQAKGLFAGASLGAASMTSDDKINAELYNKDIDGAQILRTEKIPAAAQPLVNAIKSASK